MNAVRLCFQCELEWDDGRKDCLSPVVSSPIYDKSETKHQLELLLHSIFFIINAVIIIIVVVITYSSEATTTSQLKISCLNQYRGSCAGKTEVYMLCDKVQKGSLDTCRWGFFYFFEGDLMTNVAVFPSRSADDIEIIFRRGSWKANGEFAQTDVHRQIAIVFKTPPYQDQDIAEEVEVSVSLRRISDQMESEPISFTYLPYNPGQSQAR